MFIPCEFFKTIKPALIENSSLVETLIMGGSTLEGLGTTWHLSAAADSSQFVPLCLRGIWTTTLRHGREVSVVIACYAPSSSVNGWLILPLSLSDLSISFLCFSFFPHVCLLSCQLHCSFFLSHPLAFHRLNKNLWRITEVSLCLIISTHHSRALISNHDLQMFHPGAFFNCLPPLATKKSFFVSWQRISK